jgi:hypothetical protein
MKTFQYMMKIQSIFCVAIFCVTILFVGSSLLFAQKQPEQKTMGRFYKMPIIPVQVISGSSSSSSSATPLSAVQPSSFSPDYETKYEPLFTSYSFYDAVPFNGCGPEGGKFNVPDIVEVRYTSDYAIPSVQLAAASLIAVTGGPTPVLTFPPRADGKTSEIFNLAEIACEIHDIEYATPGITKAQADLNFFNRMIDAGVPREIANWYYQAVGKFGGNAYRDAQKQANERANNSQNKDIRDHVHFFADDGSFNVGYFEDGVHGITKGNNAKAFGKEYDVKIMKDMTRFLAYYDFREWTGQLYDTENHNSNNFADALRDLYVMAEICEAYRRSFERHPKYLKVFEGNYENESETWVLTQFEKDALNELKKIDLSECSKSMVKYVKERIVNSQLMCEYSQLKYERPSKVRESKFHPESWWIDYCKGEELKTDELERSFRRLFDLTRNLNCTKCEHVRFGVFGRLGRGYEVELGIKNIR